MQNLHTNSLSVVITTYNEEKTLIQTVTALREALHGVISDYEIIIVNDASLDRTGEIAETLAKRNHRIRVFHNQRNLNQAGTFFRGVNLATKEYLYSVGGDDRIEHESQREIFKEVGRGNTIILTHMQNSKGRNFLRGCLSRLFVVLLNIITGFRLKYYNGPTIMRTNVLKSVTLSKPSFAFMAEIVIRLLKRGYPYKEVPMKLNPDPKGMNIRAITRNFFPVMATLFRLFWMVRVNKNY